MSNKRQRTFWRLETFKDNVLKTHEYKTKKAATEKAWYLVDSGRVDKAHIIKMKMQGVVDSDLDSGVEWDAPEQTGALEVIEPRKEYAYRTMGWLDGEPQDDNFMHFKTAEEARVYIDKRLRGETRLPNHNNESEWGDYDDCEADEVSLEVFVRTIPHPGSVKVDDMTFGWETWASGRVITYLENPKRVPASDRKEVNNGS